MEEYMKLALKQACIAAKKGEVPIGAIIVKNNKVIAKAYNLKEKKNISIYHAEILAIQKACKKLKSWRLNGCTMYVTVEPCAMCCGAIKESRISKLIYGTKNKNTGFVASKSNFFEDSKIIILDGICELECRNLMQEFFKKKRI